MDPTYAILDSICLTYMDVGPYKNILDGIMWVSSIVEMNPIFFWEQLNILYLQYTLTLSWSHICNFGFNLSYLNECGSLQKHN